MRAAACKADPCGGLNGKERLHMAMEYLGLSDINGPLVAVDGVKGVGFEEMVEMKTATGTRLGRIAALEGERAVIQVFAGTSGMTLSGTASRFTGSPMRLALAPEIVGRIFNGGRTHRRPRPCLRRALRGYQRQRHQPCLPQLSAQLHPHGYFFHRQPYYADPRPEAAHLLRQRHEPQQACRADRAAGQAE